jgi:asparagine synthase (glutamine-hydrolysing)
MCGFAGVVAWDERFRVTRDTLEEMSARIAHRGPDGQGLYFSPDAPITPDRPQIALAHRRLAILDPDPRANQPFTDNAGRWIVFNGEIYNFRELRKELSGFSPNFAWRTRGDTEVLLRAYAQWGEKCVDHLNGMFAFVVWDEPKQGLFLARDRMGQKPLYLAEPYCSGQPTVIAFASEISALRELPWFESGREIPALVDYLRHGYFGNESTAYSHATKVGPGMWRMFNRGRDSGDYYYWPNETRSDGIRDPAQLREAVIAAVRRQLVSDVPLGCFLSGGVDSSVIVAATTAAGSSVEPIQTFSIGFDDARYDETSYARSIATHFGTRHHEFKVRPDAAADLPKLAAAFGEPFGDSSALPTHYLARETRQHVKVALSGDGGDELFGGYDRYRAMSHERHLRRLPNSLRRRLARHAAGASGAHPKSRLARIRRFLNTIDEEPAARYAGYVRIFDDATITELLNHGAASDRDFVEVQFEALAEHCDPVRAALGTDRVSYLPDDLLTKVDRASMLHALEVRSPFMDHELVQFAAGLTTDQLLKGGPKRMLREAFADDLPAWVFKRKKMGFAVPIGDWFRGELRAMLRDHLFAGDSFAAKHFSRPVVERLVEEHETSRVDHSQRLYALLMLELWWRGEK